MDSNAQCPSPECRQSEPTALGRQLAKARPWVQTTFLGVWLAPLGQWLHGIPSCVFHCYSCPLSSFGCPVGIAANYAALLPVAFEVPYLLIGVLLAVGALGGSVVCGWACPFGFVQDLLAKITPYKATLPAWLGHGRYLVLGGLVLILPFVLGLKGIPFEEQVISICRLCPAGALEAGVPYSVHSLLTGKGWLMSSYKTAILLAFVIASIVIYRPWCRILCPLGGGLALFNRFSLFHLRFNSKKCTECSLCRSRCPVGVKVDEKVNVTGCIRCLECAKCGALEPAFASPHPEPAQKQP
jgi:ferredoxin-type protein NapH